MTCIVGLKCPRRNKVIIAGDSAGSGQGTKTTRSDSKVFANRDFVFGGTTSFRMLQLLRYGFQPPHCDFVGRNFSMRAVSTEEVDIAHFMCTRFVDALRYCFKEGGFGDDKSGGLFLVGFQDQLFVIGDDYQVGEPLDSFASVGVGAQHALGALHALCVGNDWDGVDVATRALAAASHFMPTSVSPPFRWVVCGSSEITVVEH
jgi:ATP-dependent protease HslVU (ClpYQ) peptidase subunit